MSTLDGKLKSGYLVAALEELIKSIPGVLDVVVLEAEAAGVAAVGAVVAGAAAGMGAEGGSDDASDRDFDHRGRYLLVG